MVVTWITLVEGIAIGLMIYMLGKTLRNMHGPARSSLLGGLALAILGPIPIVALICWLRSFGGPFCAVETMVAFWGVLAVASAVVGLVAGRSASST
ncbi:hypothetical protein [Thiohalorhabdus sp.]|uniref:hypothetical protein n=1 Tax=Thiohalorhabdus sp. TaxID=3094134 RepID=UPI002FC3A08A